MIKVTITKVCPECEDEQLYVQAFDALNVPALVIHINSLPPMPPPRAKRCDAGKARSKTPEPPTLGL